MGNLPTKEEHMEPLKASEQLIDCTTSLSYARLVAKMDEIKELYSIYRSTCEGFSVNMTEYVQIFQAKGETTPSHGEETFAIWDSDKNSLIDALELFTGIVLHSMASPTEKIEMLFKMFDFNGIEALSYTDVECLFTYCVTSTCKMYGISSAGIDFSLIKKMILRGVAPDAKVSQKRFAKLCCHRLITDFMKMFRMTELRLVPLIKSNEAIDTLNQIYSDVFFPVFPLWNPPYTSMRTKRFLNYRTWLGKVVIPNLQARAQKRALPWNFEATFALEWIYGISYSCNPMIQYLAHGTQSGQNHAVVYACGSAAVVYDFFAHEQHYYFQHKTKIDALAVTTDGEFVASSEFYKGKVMVHVWSTKNYDNVSQIITIQKGPIRAMAFAFANRYLVLVGSERPHALLLYDWSHGVLEMTSIMNDTPISIEQVVSSPTRKEEESKTPFAPNDILAIVTAEKVIEMRLDSGVPVFPEHCVIAPHKKITPISCATLLAPKEGDKVVSGVTGHHDGNVWYWNRPDKLPVSLINYEIPIVSIKSLGDFVVIATNFRKLYVWEVPKCCVLSVDLLLLGVNLISANILTVDICAPNSILVTTIKDVLNLQISLTDKSLLAERFHKIVSAPGTRQSCMAIVNAETIVNGAVTQRRALAVAGDSCGVAVVDCDANEFCGALQIGEQVTSMHSNMSAKWGCTLAVGTTKGNVFVAERFMQEGQKCDLVAALKNRVEDLKISPNGAYLIVISEEHNCALYERGEEGKFETSCSRKYRGCDIVFRLEKEGPTYPISVSFAEDSCSFIAYSNRIALVETKGLNLKTISLAELKEQDWLNDPSKYPLVKSKAELVTVPFCTGRVLPILVTSDTCGNIVCWKHSDEVANYVPDNYCVHACPVDSIVMSSDDQYVYSMSGNDSMICQWAVQLNKPSAPSAAAESVELSYRNGAPEISTHLLRELQFAYTCAAPTGHQQLSRSMHHSREIVPNSSYVLPSGQNSTIKFQGQKELMGDSTVLVKQSRVKILNHVLATDKYSEVRNEVKRPPTEILELEHVYGMQCGHRRNCLRYYHQCTPPLPSPSQYSHSGLTERSELLTKTEQEPTPILMSDTPSPLHKNCARKLLYAASKYMVIEGVTEADRAASPQWIYQCHGYSVTCYTQHPKLNLVASADTNNNVHLWNKDSKEPVRMFKVSSSDSGISCLDFSPDGELLLALGSGKQSLTVVNWTQEREIAFRHLNEALILEARFSPVDSRKIVAIGKGIVMEIDLTSTGLLPTSVVWPQLATPKDSIIMCMDFLTYMLGDVQAADVYLGTSGGEVAILVSHQFEKLSAEPLHSGAINCIKMTKQLGLPACIVTAGDDNVVKISDLSMKVLCAVNVPELDIYRTVSDPAAGSGIPKGFLNGIHSIDLYTCKPGSLSLLIGLRCGDVVETELLGAELELKESKTNGGDSPAGTPEGGRESSEPGQEEPPSSIRRVLKRVDKGRLLLRAHSSLGKSGYDRKVCIAVMPNSALLVSAGYDCTIRLWNAKTDSLLWMDNLGMGSKDVRVSAMEFSPEGDLLVLGLFSGKVIYYGFPKDVGTGELRTPQISMKFSTHDSQGCVLALRFSADSQYLAVSYNAAVANKSNSVTGLKVSGTVLVYAKNVFASSKSGKADIYAKVKRIDVPLLSTSSDMSSVRPGLDKSSITVDDEESTVPKERCAVQAEFSKDGRYMQLCYLPVYSSGRVLYSHEPTCIVWDLNKDSVAEDWEQLMNVEWNGLAFAPAIYARYLGSVLKAGSNEEELDYMAKEQVVLSSFLVLTQNYIYSTACSGSTTGDLHIFRYAALLSDRNEPVLPSSSLYGKAPMDKESMAVTRSWNAFTSGIEKVDLAVDGDDQWLILSSVADEVIIKYRLLYDDCRWNLDYLYTNPALFVEDPFQELPSKERFMILLNEKWCARSSIGRSKATGEGKMSLQLGWVFGRRAFDRRNNLKFDYLRRVVYSSGTMLILVDEHSHSHGPLSTEGEAKTHGKRPKQILVNPAADENVAPEISCLAISASKHLVAFGTAETQAHICAWDVSTSTEVAVVPIIGASLVYALKVHRDERHVVAIVLIQEFKQAVLVVDLAERTEICRVTQIHSVPYKIRDVDFFPGESFLRFVTCGIQHLSFWSRSGHFMEQEAAELTLEPDATNFSGISRTDVDKSVATGSQSVMETKPRVCGALMFCKDMKQEVELIEDQHTVYATFMGLGFINNSMLTIGDDGCVYIWENRKIVRKRQGHSGAILCMDISEKEMLVATGGVDAKVVLWIFDTRSSHGLTHTDLGKIRSIHLRSGVDKSPDICYTESSKCVQSVCLDHGTLMIGTRSGSVHVVDIADSAGNVKPKQSDTASLKDFMDWVDDETPQCMAFDQLQNRLCYLSKKGFFAVFNIDTQLLVYSKRFNSSGRVVHMFRTTGYVLLGFENEIIMLSNKYVQIPEMRIEKPNVTAMRISSNDAILVVAYVESGVPKLTGYEIGKSFKEFGNARGFKSAIVALDFTTDDNYLFAADELGEQYRFEVDQLNPLRNDKKTEVHLDWQSCGLRTDGQYATISKFYSNSNKISTISRIQRGDSTIIVVGDQSGTLKLYRFPVAPSEGYLVCKYEHLNWIGQCVVTKDATTMWTFAEDDRCIIKWRIGSYEPPAKPGSAAAPAIEPSSPASSHEDTPA